MKGVKPTMLEATPSANHFTKPTLLRPPASATRVANQASVFHAALLAMTSSQLMTPVTSIRQITTSATVVALMKSPPKIHSASASSTSAASVSSRRVMPPIFCSSAAAQRGTSSPLFTPGG